MVLVYSITCAILLLGLCIPFLSSTRIVCLIGGIVSILTMVNCRLLDFPYGYPFGIALLLMSIYFYLDEINRNPFRPRKSKRDQLK